MMRLPKLVPVATLLLACLVWAPGRAAAETTYTWVGNTQDPNADNESWGDERNWDPKGVPTDGDSVVITQPSDDDCFAHVVGTPTVSLTNFTLEENPAHCTTSVADGAITVTGLFQWSGGQLKTPITVAGTGAVSVSGGNQRLNSLSADLDVNGTMSLLGVTGDGALRIDAGRTLHIEPGGTLVSTGPNEIFGATCCTVPPVVRNEGTLSVNAATLTIAAAELDQFGDVAATVDGRLKTTDAPITTSPHATNGYTGNGSWLIETRAAPKFTGTQAIGSGFRIDFGGLHSTFSSTMTGSATLKGHGTFAWTGGVINADLTIAHGLSVDVLGAHTGGAQRVLKGRDFSGGGPGVATPLTNHGVITVGNGAVVNTAQSARLINAADGVLALEPGTSISGLGCCVSPDRVVNAGILTVLPTQTTGPVVLGLLSYRSTGATGIAAGRTLQLTGGGPGEFTGGTVNGGGRLLVNTPTALDGTVHLGGHTLVTVADHGSLDGTASLVGAGRLTWTGGSMSGHLLSIAPAGGSTISGPAIKAVRTVGGGSQTSTVRFETPVRTSAGTAAAHNLSNVAPSRVILAAPTDAGAYTEFAGTLLDRAALALHTGTVFTDDYDQGPSAELTLGYTHARHGKLSLFGSAAVDGIVRVRNAAAPAVGDRIVVVDAGSLTSVPACVTTSGTRATGSRAGHWAASRSGGRLILTWRRGAHTHC